MILVGFALIEYTFQSWNCENESSFNALQTRNSLWNSKVTKQFKISDNLRYHKTESLSQIRKHKVSLSQNEKLIS